MKDDASTQELARLFAEAQRNFDELARRHHAACEAFEAAKKARVQAVTVLGASFDELQGFIRTLFERGALQPLRLEEGLTYLALARLRDERELHADVTPTPGECPDPSAN